MGGAPLLVVVSLTAFVTGFFPGLLATCVSMRGELSRSDWWPWLKVMTLARAATTLVAGFLLPLGIAFAGLVASYFLSNGSGYVGYVAPALLGGWVMSVEPRWLGTLALVTAYSYYAATLGLALPFERWIVRKLAPRFARPELARAFGRGIVAAYVVQPLVALFVIQNGTSY